MAPGGSCALLWLMLRPIPMIAKDTRSPKVFDSMRIPPSFASSRTRSLGHFSLTPRPVSSSRAFLAATAARNCSVGSFALGTLGLSRTENQRPPLGDSHLFLPRPLPFVWTSATTTVHSEADSCASRYAVVLVDCSVL
jgi:hypothetical protein